MKNLLHFVLFIAISFLGIVHTNAQLFSPLKVVTSTALEVQSVYTADLDNDGDQDILAAQGMGDKISWYENYGGGNFSSEQIIANGINEATDVLTADTDNDGDQDVLCTSFDDGHISLIENLGGGNFGTPQAIGNSDGAYRIYAADMDNDGDEDVLSAAWPSDELDFHENLGGSFAAEDNISTAGNGCISIHAADFDADGLMDVLSANFFDSDITWHKNLGGGNFAPPTFIATAPFVYDVYTADIDNDGDQDIVSSDLSPNGRLAWHPNLGSGVFGPAVTISDSSGQGRSVYCADFDMDNLVDILTTDFNNGLVTWYKNLGGSFGPANIIASGLSTGYSVHASDLDNDGDLDVLATDVPTNRIVWMENKTIKACPPPVNLSYTYTSSLLGGTIDLDWDSVPSSLRYKVKIKRTSSSIPKSKNFFPIDDLLSINGMFMPGEIYKWKVKAACTEDTSDWSSQAIIIIPALKNSPEFEAAPFATSTAVLYPNPASDFLLINAPFADLFKLEISDVSGRIVYSQLGLSGATTIDLTKWEAGTYFYALVNKEGTTAADQSESIHLNGHFVKLK